MNVREQIGRLETLLSRIQSHARARRDASLGERRVVLESYTSEAPTSSLEVVDSAPPEALDDDDVLEMSSDVLESVPPPPVAASAAPAELDSAPEVFAREELADTDLDFTEEDEAPASSKRHRIASTIGDIATTIDDAVSAREREPVLIQEGREVPLKTPPPESGPQEAPPPPGSLAPPPAPDISDLLDELPPEEPAFAAGPRPEQLGDTIELNAPMGPPLELDASPSYTPPPPTPDLPEELEVTLPRGKYAGNYDDALMPPPEAQRDLLEHRRKSGELLTPERSARADADEPDATWSAPALGTPRPAAPEISFDNSPLDLSFQPPVREQATVPAPQAAGGPTPSHVAVRGSLSGLSAAEFSGSLSRPQTPKSFLEILDESLRLGE